MKFRIMGINSKTESLIKQGILTEDLEETTNLSFEPSMDSIKTVKSNMLIGKMKQINDPV